METMKVRLEINKIYAQIVWKNKLAEDKCIALLG